MEDTISKHVDNLNVHLSGMEKILRKFNTNRISKKLFVDQMQYEIQVMFKKFDELEDDLKFQNIMNL